MSGESWNWEQEKKFIELVKTVLKRRDVMFSENVEVTSETKVEPYEKMKTYEQTIQAGIAKTQEENLKRHRDISGSTTGLRYNEGKLPWHLVDFRALKSMVEVLEYGAKKYAEDQWKKGLSLKEIRDSFIRHMIEWNSGQEIDSESGKSHIGHMMCNLLFYEYFTKVDSSKIRD